MPWMIGCDITTSVGSSDPKPGITRGLDPIFRFFQFKALGIFSISGWVGFRPDFFFQLFSGQGLESSQIKFQLQLGLFQGLKNKFFQVNSRKSWKNPKQIRFTFLLSLLLLACPSGVAIEDNVGNRACQGQGLSRTGPVGLAGPIFDRPRLWQAPSPTGPVPNVILFCHPGGASKYTRNGYFLANYNCSLLLFLNWCTIYFLGSLISATPVEIVL